MLKNTLLFGLFLAMISCGGSGDAPATSQAEPVRIPDDFLTFYEEFHSDSLFQLAHISWPLRGEARIDSTSRGEIQWKKEQWKIHRRVDFEKGEYKQELQMVGDVVVVERIRTSMGNFGLERRFAKQSDGSWELIFYTDMHELK